MQDWVEVGYLWVQHHMFLALQPGAGSWLLRQFRLFNVPWLIPSLVLLPTSFVCLVIFHRTKDTEEEEVKGWGGVPTSPPSFPSSFLQTSLTPPPVWRFLVSLLPMHPQQIQHIHFGLTHWHALLLFCGGFFARKVRKLEFTPWQRIIEQMAFIASIILFHSTKSHDQHMSAHPHRI